MEGRNMPKEVNIRKESPGTSQTVVLDRVDFSKLQLSPSSPRTQSDETHSTSNIGPLSTSTNMYPLPTISVEESPKVPMSIDVRAIVGGKGCQNTPDFKRSDEMIGELSPSESVSLECGESSDDKQANSGGYERRKRYSSRRSQKVGHVSHPKETGNLRKAFSTDGKLNEIQAEELQKRLKDLAAAFAARTMRTKEKIQQPPTPSSEESEPEDANGDQPSLLERLLKLADPTLSIRKGDIQPLSMSQKVEETCHKIWARIFSTVSCTYILDPQSWMYVSWLVLVGIVFLYNAYVIPLRVVFPYQTQNNARVWFAFDCFADVVYLVDMIAFKPHVKFLQNGFWVKEPRQTVHTYLATWQFRIDITSLFPADIVVNFAYKNVPLLRLPRLLKVNTFWELFRLLDTVLANPHRARIFHTCLYMLYMIHMVACSYYALSTWEGIGTTTWTFDGHGNAYVRCFYFATKTATSIGKNPKPENELEYMFMTFAWLSGVFVFAILIGQIRDIIATATKSQTEYRILVSAASSYLHRLGVPNRLQDRVKLWLNYTWQQQKTLDETRILSLLPKHMKQDIALNIHVETLAKVQLFQNCETGFLQDLVVKLRSIIILPGDFVCRKGEIGREMFIVKSGKIHVVGATGQVLATLGEGSVFGEIALLGIGGMNKRTADVKAAGFVNLFVLSKFDLNTTTRDYPEVQEIMQKKAKKLMKETIKKNRASPVPEDCVSLAESEVIIKNRVEPPQLISTVLKLFPPTTKIGRYLTQGSKLSSEVDVHTQKVDDTSLLTSYPPSPFIPTYSCEAGELDISIMTGDSSEKMLESQLKNCASDMTLFDNDEYEDQFNDTGHTFHGSHGTQLEIVDMEARCESPPPLSETSWEASPHPEFKKGGDTFRKSCPTLAEASRENVPVEMRAPLYLIQEGQRASHLRKVSSTTRAKAHDMETNAGNDTAKPAFLATRFISKLRTPLERQMEIDGAVQHSPQQPQGVHVDND